ncbi:MAG: hypothetical protein NT051_05915 [Candidatus Micrarchaeota archaeon]|nr:hypothetical protein [Candidatus Micrarchaeota archaeon]
MNARKVSMKELKANEKAAKQEFISLWKDPFFLEQAKNVQPGRLSLYRLEKEMLKTLREEPDKAGKKSLFSIENITCQVLGQMIEGKILSSEYFDIARYPKVAYSLQIGSFKCEPASMPAKVEKIAPAENDSLDRRNSWEARLPLFEHSESRPGTFFNVLNLSINPRSFPNVPGFVEMTAIAENPALNAEIGGAWQVSKILPAITGHFNLEKAPPGEKISMTPEGLLIEISNEKQILMAPVPPFDKKNALKGKSRAFEITQITEPLNGLARKVRQALEQVDTLLPKQWRLE